MKCFHWLFVVAKLHAKTNTKKSILQDKNELLGRFKLITAEAKDDKEAIQAISYEDC